MGNQRRASARSILPPFIACSGRQGITVKGPRTYNEIPVFVAVFHARRHGWPPHMRVSAIGTDRPSSELGRYFMDQKTSFWSGTKSPNKRDPETTSDTLRWNQ